MKLQHKLAVMATLLAAFGGPAQGAKLCSSYSPASHPDKLSVTDMTFQGSDADDCYGVIKDKGGNPTSDTVWATTGWTQLAKDEGSENVGNVNGIEFTLTSDRSGDDDLEGDWLLSWKKVGEPGYDLTMDIVGVLKASNRSASYLFEDLKFTSDDSGSGTWKIAFNNNGGQLPGLSNLQLWYKNPQHTEPGPTPGAGVPMPGPLALVALGLLAMSWRRRQNLSEQG